MALSPKGIAQRLKTLRQEQGLTMRAVAKKAKPSVGYLAILGTGKKQNPSLVVLERVAKALGVPMTELLG